MTKAARAKKHSMAMYMEAVFYHPAVLERRVLKQPFREARGFREEAGEKIEHQDLKLWGTLHSMYKLMGITGECGHVFHAPACKP